MITVIVPVLGRPENAAPLTDSLRSATSTPHQLVFVCSPQDLAKQQACQRVGGQLLVVDWEPERGDYARKLNHAYRQTESEFIFCGADDIRFHPGWDTEALRVAEQTGAGVVGTNDLGNPAVFRKQQFSTHPLVRRSYIDEQGGSLDGPGYVYHEGYDHNFVDRELWDLAEHRGQTAFALGSHVEHLHPHWGKGENDATYEKGLRDFYDDQRRYWSRCQHWGKPLRPGEQRELRIWLRKQQ